MVSRLMGTTAMLRRILYMSSFHKNNLLRGVVSATNLWRPPICGVAKDMGVVSATLSTVEALLGEMMDGNKFVTCKSDKLVYQLIVILVCG